MNPIDNSQAVIGIIIMSLATFLTRAAPFLIFGNPKRKVPKPIAYIGSVLPAAIIAVLVIYCFKNVNIGSGSHGIPELIASLLVIALHLWKKNSVVSVLGGTICYMILVSLVFV